MHVPEIWRVLWILSLVGASLCVNEVEYYADNYDNEISPGQQEVETQTAPCPAGDLSRWDRLFVFLEDSHMRQNMLLQSLEQCCGGVLSLRIQVEKLSKGTCQQCLPRMESACRVQAEEASIRLKQTITELQEEEAERERRLNATLQHLLRSGREGNTRLKRLEEAGVGDRVVQSGETNRGIMGSQPTTGPGGLGAAVGSGMKQFPSGLKEQEVATPQDMATMEKTLVAIATELQKVHLQLSRVIEQAGTMRKGRGDT